MAQCKLTPHEFIQNAFSPMVAVMCSQLVDQTCQKNNLSFVEMIQPFCKLNTEGWYSEYQTANLTLMLAIVYVYEIYCYCCSTFS